MSFWNDLKKSVKDLGKEIKKTTNNLKTKDLINKAFAKAATEYEVLGKKGLLGENATILAVPDFGAFKKDLLIDSEDMTDRIKEGTILVCGTTRYEIKSIANDKQEYYDVDIEYEEEKQEEGKDPVKETVHETHQVAVTRVSVKELK